MEAKPTIAVLLPFVGGEYYGAIVTGVTRAAAGAGVAVIAIQTLDAGTYLGEVIEAPAVRRSLAWQRASGFVVGVDAATPSCLAAIQEAGKPVILIGHEFTGLAAPVVRSDDSTGVRAAVEHLIEHGHRRIAFAGRLAVDDVNSRFMAYRSVLVEHGIPVDPALIYDTQSNHESGGEAAAAAMLAAGMPSTAVLTGTDANAVGLIRQLRGAGLSLPKDQAIVGFDDVAASRYTTPALSTIRQYPAALGGTAATLLLQHLRGGDLPARQHSIPTSFVARQSCGCSGPQANRGQAESSQAAAARLRERISALLPPSTDEEHAALDVLVEGVGAVVDSALSDTEHSGDRLEPLRPAVESLYRGSGPPETPGSIASTLLAYADERLMGIAGTLDVTTSRRVDRCVLSLVLLFTEEYGRAQFNDTTFFHGMFNMQYELGLDLLRSHEQEPRRLKWFERTPFRAGCLGIWANGRSSQDPDAQLEIASFYVQHGTPPEHVATATASDFPPQELCALADSAAGEVTFVTPVKLGQRDWGVLATVTAADSRVSAGSEITNHSGGLLAVALDYESAVSALREREQQLERAALFDQLTGLPNRTMFLDRLNRAIHRSERIPEYRFAVLFLDLDGFKIVNDSLGHTVGDRLLVQVGERLRRVLRSIDTAARFGGDEFLILLDGVDSPGRPAQVTERLKRVLAEPFHLGGRELVVSASIGITLGDSQYHNTEDVLRDADIAMYSAKATKKGSHAVFDVAMRTKAVSRLEIEADLREALETDQLEVHYQPIVDLRTGTTAGAEALVRWRHPTRGLLPPDQFLSIAEDSGLIVPISRRMLQRSCEQLNTWRTDGTVRDDMRISVNVSNKQFWHDDLVETVDECLERSGLPARLLALEITEGVVMHNVDVACKVLENLHERGVGLHIDDFGTGYSSLEVLHQLPIDALKIDRSFVSRLGVDRRSEELVRTIVLMSSGLGLDVVAEGIETSNHRDHLRKIGCGHGQGYWFSRPLPAELASSRLGREAERAAQ